MKVIQTSLESLVFKLQILNYFFRDEILANLFMILNCIVESILPITVCCFSVKTEEINYNITKYHVLASLFFTLVYKSLVTIKQLEYSFYFFNNNSNTIYIYQAYIYVINILCYGISSYIYFNIEHYMSYFVYHLIISFFAIIHFFLLYSLSNKYNKKSK